MTLVRHRLGPYVATVIAAATLSACGGSSGGESGADPATVEPVKGTDLNRVTLSPQATRRLGIKTAQVRRSGERTTVPYGAIVYSPAGSTFTYTSPKPRVYVRAPISVVRIADGQATLSRGPAVGTVVVTVGSQELYGSEYEVEED